MGTVYSHDYIVVRHHVRVHRCFKYNAPRAGSKDHNVETARILRGRYNVILSQRYLGVLVRRMQIVEPRGVV